jgi:hypothetical protein
VNKVTSVVGPVELFTGPAELGALVEPFRSGEKIARKVENGYLDSEYAITANNITQFTSVLDTCPICIKPNAFSLTKRPIN